MAQLNILIMGKSGAGKSTLMNYLMDGYFAEAKAGRPQTEMGIYPYHPIKSNGVDMVFSDTWGLEANKASEWASTILNVANDTELNSDINAWYHCAIYCISAKGARLEEFEIDNIINPLLDRGTSVVIALTKSDLASEEEKNGLKALINTRTNKPVTIVDISSETKTLRSGKVTEQFGKELMLETMSKNIRTNLINKMKGMFLIKTNQQLDMLNDTLLDYFKQHDGMTVGAAEISSQIDAVSKLAVENYFLKVEYWLLHNIMQARLLFISFGRQFHLNETVADRASFYQDQFKLIRKYGDVNHPLNAGFKGIDNEKSLLRELTEFIEKSKNAAQFVADSIELN